MTLYFKDKTQANCKLLGSVEEDGKRYAVFLCPSSKELYIYKYKRKKRKAKLYPITKQDEFKRVCARLSNMIGEKNGHK